MRLGIENRVALISGAASPLGIGSAAARALAAEGARVFLADVNGGGVRRVAEEIIASGGQAKAIQCDQSSLNNVQNAVAEACSQSGAIDILVNSAALTDNVGGITRMPPEKWQYELDVSLNGAFYWFREVLPVMRENQWGRVINISSITSMFGGTGCPGYVASKGGLNSLIRQIAKDFARFGVTANSLVLGMFDTGIYDRGDFDLEVIRGMVNQIPVRRMGRPAEAGSLIAWLCSDYASFVTGADLVVDGGTSVSL